MKSFQLIRSPAISLTSFHDLLVPRISSSIVLRHVLFGLPLLLYPWGFQSNAVFSIDPVCLRNVCPNQFHFLLLIYWNTLYIYIYIYIYTLHYIHHQYTTGVLWYVKDTHSPMKMKHTKCSETLAIKLHTPENNPKENIWHSKHRESLKSIKDTQVYIFKIIPLYIQNLFLSNFDILYLLLQTM
jgi:hypothetical protein